MGKWSRVESGQRGVRGAEPPVWKKCVGNDGSQVGCGSDED